MKSRLLTIVLALLLTDGASGQDLDSAVAANPEADETAEPAVSFWDREKLTGDWWGRREVWSNSGLTVDFSATHVFQGVPSGGFGDRLFPLISNEGDTGQTLAGDLQAALDTSKAGLWDGGVFKARMQGRTGRSILQRAGVIAAVNNEAVFPIVLDRFDQSAFAISEMTYEHSLSDVISVFGGLVNASEGDENVIGGSALSHAHFLNFAMLYSLVEDATVPHTSLGGGLGFEPAENISGSFSVFGSAETAGENPFKLWHGTTFSSEWTFGHTLGDRSGAQTVGLLYGINARRTDIAADPRLVLVSLLTGLPLPTTKADTWALYYNAHQFLQGDEEEGWGVFGRFGVSDGNPNFVKWNTAIGVGGIGLLPGRNRDSWGLGVFFLDMSEEDLLQGLGVRDELGSEWYYNIALTPAFRVTLDAQVMSSGLPRVDTTLVLGLRTHLVF